VSSGVVGIVGVLLPYKHAVPRAPANNATMSPDHGLGKGRGDSSKQRATRGLACCLRPLEFTQSLPPLSAAALPHQ
jgi:hypothetical protein